jgi:hypothetical protein
MASAARERLLKSARAAWREAEGASADAAGQLAWTPKERKACVDAARIRATQLGAQRSREERYKDSARLEPAPDQTTDLLRAARASCEAWNFAIQRPGMTAYAVHSAFKQRLRSALEDAGEAHLLPLLAAAAHCAVRDAVTKIFYKENPQPRDPNTLIQFRVGSRLACLTGEGLHVGLAEAVPVVDHGIKLADIGSPYIVSARLSWTFDDGWRVDFLLRDDPDSKLTMAALDRGGY